MAATLVRSVDTVFAVVRNVGITCGPSIGSRCVGFRSNSKLLYYCRNYCQSTQGGDGAERPSKGSKVKLDTVRPGRAFEARKKAKENKISSAVESVDLDPKLVTAVDTVAESLGANQRKTRSELLMKLQEHSHTREKPQSGQDVSSILAGMQVEKLDASNDSRRQSPKQKYQSFSGDKRVGDSSDPSRRTRERAHRFGKEDSRLYDGRALGIFPANISPDHYEVANSTMTLFDILHQEETEVCMAMPPDNRFNEMIQWTKEGKLWKFPIDNEHGLDEEQNVGFHEHVFMEQLVDSRFPTRGPIRQFMELVAVGLSANPYLTVAEKQVHIAWYADYFKDKNRFVDQSQQVLTSSESAEIQNTEALNR